MGLWRAADDAYEILAVKNQWERQRPLQGSYVLVRAIVPEGSKKADETIMDSIDSAANCDGLSELLLEHVSTRQ